VLRTLFETDHEDFRAVVRKFVEREILPNDASFEASGSFSRDLWRAAGDQGFLGLYVPTEYGGSDVRDYRFNAVLDEELTHAGLAYAAALGVHTHVVAPYLVHLTTEEQRKRWLPDFCTGDLVTAVAMTEPSGGSDLAALQTRAVHDGSDWKITGSKIFITNGATADLVIVAARTQPGTRSEGITLFAVDSEMAGFDRGSKLRKLGQHQGDTAQVYLDDVRVPYDNVIGEPHRGFYHMMEHLSQERLASAVCNISNARDMTGWTIDYVRNRQAFGRTIGALQNTRFVLADLMTEIDVTQSFVDACIVAHNQGLLSPADAAKAKLKSSEVQNSVADACLQLHGGYGYMYESRIARAWQDARVTKIWAGTNEIMREVVGRSLAL
jgi:alkylation response protein AidB-like acyl-CoA dehydrogenase